MAALSLFFHVQGAQAASQTFELLNGDILRGEVLERDAKRIVIQHPFLGRVEIPVEQIAPSSAHPGLLGTSVLRGWNKELTLGMGGSQGDTDEADLRLQAKLEVADEHRRWRIEGRYELSFADGDTDENNAHATVLRDWLWPQSKWFAFAYSLYDYDDFENWKHRVTAGVGPGYHLFKNAPLTLDGRTGPFLTYEFGDEDTARPEWGAGLFLLWKIREWHSIEFNNVYFQTLDEAELRLVTRLNWKIRLSFNHAVSLKLGIDNEYDSASEKSKDNLQYFTAIAFDL